MVLGSPGQSDVGKIPLGSLLVEDKSAHTVSRVSQLAEETSEFSGGDHKPIFRSRLCEPFDPIGMLTEHSEIRRMVRKCFQDLPNAVNVSQQGLPVRGYHAANSTNSPVWAINFVLAD